MKILAFTLSLLSLTCTAEDGEPEKKYSIGVGMGALYTGIGANLSIISTTDMKYISAGCVETSSVDDSTCGFGAGWIKTDLFDFDSNKHGFGVYASLVGHESDYTLENNEYVYHNEDYYGVGLSYTYFVSGIDDSGATIGVSFHATNAEFEGRFGALFQIGYQF